MRLPGFDVPFPPLATLLALLLFVCSCAREEASDAPAPPPPPEREAWWSAATARPSGDERILAPRELRALLEEGRRYGFDADTAWWRERRDWVFARILEMDPDDVQANEAMGRKTLQGIEGFEALWQRMLEARATNAAITELLERYEGWVAEGRPIFLTRDEHEVARALLRDARIHLDRLAADPQYAALQVALERVRTSSLSDYPFVHASAGPFLLFLAAPDLQRIVGEEEAAEDQRLAGRREVYEQRLARLGEGLVRLLDDLATLYPELWKRHAPGPRDIVYQWIFADRGWYATHRERINREDAETPYRCGFLDAATGWAFLFEPPEPEAAAEGGAEGPARPVEPEAILKETMAYLAVAQLMRGWARDERDPTLNHLDRCRAYWLMEGWPSFLAARQVERPQVGPLLHEANRFGWRYPPLGRVVERQSRLELERYFEPIEETDEGEEDRAVLRVRQGFTDLAWLLVRHLNADERRPTFERHLLDQLAGASTGIEAFEAAFGLDGPAAWRALERAVYASIKEN